MTHAPTSRPAPVGRPRVSVTAVVVTRGQTEYLDQTLAALAAQTRPPEHVLVVDAGSPEAPPAPGAVPAPDARTFGDAVRTGLTHVATRQPADDGPRRPAGTLSWLWLLHDDSAPAPDALAALLRAVELAPSVVVAGCKQHTWSEPVRVLEVGVTTSRFGRRMTGLDAPEVDQGQHDAREDVLAVGLAGALVRRDVWDELDGPDPALGPYGDGLDLCRRARLAGHRVVVVPGAVVRHAQASLARPVAGAILNRPGWDARRSAQARREAYLHGQLTEVPVGLVPVVAVLAVVSSLVRAMVRLVLKEPHLVLAELVAPWAVLLRPGRVVRARRRATRTRRLRRSSLRPLQVTWRDVLRQERDRRLAAAELRRIRSAPSELEIAELAALRSRRRTGLTLVLIAAIGLTLVTLRPLVAGVLGGGDLVGGTLAGGAASAREILGGLGSGWVAGDLGHAAAADPLLTALLPLAAVTGSLGGAVALVVLGALVLAALGAWFAAGTVTRSVGLRAWASLVWTAAPALLVGLDQGRLGGLLAHVALPWLVLGVARAIGAGRIDVVESGVVGARRERPLDADRDGERESEREDLPETSRPVPTSVRYAEPSLAAAAAAGLAFVLVSAGAPVLLPVGLLGLAALALVTPHRRRLLWVAVPAVVVQGPTIAEAVSTWGQGGWRVLLADPGVPVAVTGTPLWQQLLGWPTAPTWAQVAGPAGEALPFVATGIVLVPAVLALLRSARAGSTARLAWVVVALGLLAALVAARAHVAVAAADGPDVSAVLTGAWHGPGLSLALAGLLLAALVGADGLRARMSRYTFGWRQATVGLLAAAAVLGPAAVLGAWTWDARSWSGTEVADGGGSMPRALALRTEPVVPAVGRQMQTSGERMRVLSLEVGALGGVDAVLLRGDGRQLTEVSRSVTGAGLLGAYGAGELAVADEAEGEAATAVAELVSGTSDEVGARLAALGIGAVLVPAVDPVGLDDDAAAALAAGHGELVGLLDSTLGLERMTETPSGVIWRVAAGELGTTAAWARLLHEVDGAPGELIGPVAAEAGRIETTLAAGEGPRLLVLAERADTGWRAWLDGRPLRAVTAGWQQAFELGAEDGLLVVEHSPAARTPWLVVQGVVLLATVLLALPTRRRRGGAR